MKTRVFVLLSVTLLWSHQLAAAPAVELRVRGMIKPAACELVFANGGSVDIGAVSKRLLRRDHRTLLPDELLNFSITCDSPALVVLDVTDNRAGSAPPSASAKPPPFLFGMGKVAGADVGVYTLSFDNRAIADGSEVRLVRTDNRTDWQGAQEFIRPNWRHSWTAHSSLLVPTAFSNLTGVMVLAPAIMPAKDLPAQDEIAIDGMASFELNYL